VDALISALSSSPILFSIVCAIAGLMVGSFLNVVIYRLPKMMETNWRNQCAELDGRKPEEGPRFNLVFPRSRCDSCGHSISAIENIPILSYIFLKGKCRHCGNKIPARVAAIEAITGILSGLAAWHFGFGLHALGALIFLWSMIALTFIDIDTQLLPDSITLPLLWIGLLFNLDGRFSSLHFAVLGAVFGYLSLWSIYWLFKLATKKEGMGYGDFKLLGAIGAWLGAGQLPLVILLSSVVGAAIGIAMIVFAKHEHSKPIPFGPYLAGGGLIALFWGHDIARAYLG
jgi:leader peptidase (prepilin peptidase)/N-methyltransferase